MADEPLSSSQPLVLRGINWRETFPFTHIFRGFRIAIHPSKLILGLIAPHLLDLWEAGRRRWAVAVIVLLLVQLVPYPQLYDWVTSQPYWPAYVRVEEPQILARWAEVVVSYRSFGVLALAAAILVGPTRPRPA